MSRDRRSLWGIAETKFCHECVFILLLPQTMRIATSSGSKSLPFYSIGGYTCGCSDIRLRYAILRCGEVWKSRGPHGCLNCLLDVPYGSPPLAATEGIRYSVQVHALQAELWRYTLLLQYMAIRNSNSTLRVQSVIAIFYCCGVHYCNCFCSDLIQHCVLVLFLIKKSFYPKMIQLWCNKILKAIERIIGGYIVNLMPVHGASRLKVLQPYCSLRQKENEISHKARKEQKQ